MLFRSTGPIAQAEPLAARELLWQFLELGNNVLGRCDDSSGLLGDVFRQAMGELGRITEAAQPDPATLVEQAFEAFCDNGYGVFDGVIQQVKQGPGPRGTAAAQEPFRAVGGTAGSRAAAAGVAAGGLGLRRPDLRP